MIKKILCLWPCTASLYYLSFHGGIPGPQNCYEDYSYIIYLEARSYVVTHWKATENLAEFEVFLVSVFVSGVSVSC